MGLSMLLGGLRYKAVLTDCGAGEWFLHDLGSDCNCFATLVISTSNGVEQAAIANLNYSSSGANRSLWSNTAIFWDHLYVGVVDLEEADVESTAQDNQSMALDRCVSSIYCRCCLWVRNLRWSRGGSYTGGLTFFTGVILYPWIGGAGN